MRWFETCKEYMMHNYMEIIDFRFIHRKDTFEKKYIAWSRIYEYPVVLETIAKLGGNINSNIHNTSWGFEGCHVTFKNDLDRLYPHTIHSDIKASKYENTTIYDITKKPGDELKDKFDFVINVSTVEEVNYSHVEIIKNLLSQVKQNGYLIITFDYKKSSQKHIGSINLSEVEKFLGAVISTGENIISGLNSENPEERNKLLNCGLLVIKKC